MDKQQPPIKQHPIESHKRINDILLGPLERPALQWLAAHMPAWMTPDILTAIGMFGSLLIFISFTLTNLDKNFLWLASLGFVINWFGDSLDGTLARYRKIQRPKYGFFIDHTMDALSETIVFIGVGLSPYVRFEIACLALIGYLLMSILVYVRTAVDGEFKISYAGIGPTEIRLIAILGNVVVYFSGNPSIRLPWGSLTIYDIIGASLAILFFIAFLVSTTIQARKYARQDERRTPARVRKTKA